LSHSTLFFSGDRILLFVSRDLFLSFYIERFSSLTFELQQQTHQYSVTASQFFNRQNIDIPIRKGKVATTGTPSCVRCKVEKECKKPDIHKRKASPES
jgi:hypothetical protein